MTTKNSTVEMRRCIGSKTFGIQLHDAPISDFPKQPSQKDGLGRMCKAHWTAYTNALRRAALARNAAEAEAPPAAERGAETIAPEPAPQGRNPSIAEVLSNKDSAEELLDALGGPFAAS